MKTEIIDKHLVAILRAAGPGMPAHESRAALLAAVAELAPASAAPDGELRPTACPHAAPFAYCQRCVASPCPIGLGK